MKRPGSIFLLLIFLFSLTTASLAKEDSEEEKLQEIEKKLEAKREKLLKVKQEEQAVLGRLTVIHKELKKTQQSLDLAQRKIKTNESQIGILSSELRQTQKELNSKESALKSRLQEAYKSGGFNYLDLVLSAGSISDFLNRSYFLGKVILHDASLVKAIVDDVEKAKRKRAVLEDKTQEVRQLAVEIKQKKTEITAQAEDKEKVYTDLKQRRQEYEAQVAELEKSSKELEAMILQKIAERKGQKIRGSGTLAWPLQGRLTSFYGYRRHPLWGGRSFHTGLDIANKYGTPVKAADDGEVIFSGWWDGYGKAIVVDHGNKITTVYGHLSRIYKKVGTIVAKGQVIGLVGSTGYSTGPHLHFEVRVNGKPQNPAPYLN